ncbi:MAG: serpin family protein [Clostridia bacterium]|nr:serpin family protein [Clostridia bacterium]
MKKRVRIFRSKLRIIALMLSALLFASFGCTGREKSGTASFMKLNAEPRANSEVSPKQPDKAFAEAHADFMVELFKNSIKKGENSLVSPLSVLTALAMTENGARGDTLIEMEDTLSSGMETADLNAYLSAYIDSLTGDKNAKVEIANSVWFRESAEALKTGSDAPRAFTPNEDFLQTNADIYGADIIAAAFDKATVAEINHWVKEKTNGMIDSIIDEIDPLAVMQLINALTFEAEWQQKYTMEHQVLDGEFTALGGVKRTVKFMSSVENTYVQLNGAEGFIKPYNGGRFAFLTLLPNAGKDIYDFIDGLNGEDLHSLIDNAQERTVYARMPKFSFEFEASLVDALKAMGMGSAFDGATADFTGLGESVYGNIRIAEVLHKTYIEVGEQGTKAGAVTSVMPAPGSAQVETEPKTIKLDRPFVFMIIDTETSLPLFIGALTDTGK